MGVCLFQTIMSSLEALTVLDIGSKSVLRCRSERFCVVLSGNNFPFISNNTGKSPLAEHSAQLTEQTCCLLIKYKSQSHFKPYYLHHQLEFSEALVIHAAWIRRSSVGKETLSILSKNIFQPYIDLHSMYTCQFISCKYIDI